ncbi:MAG: cohesin domain-containing protein, partial [Candidatus Marinimicrobia bacterium]|nr:cohesin domain-containing protein [Candidatus Neomarinimicrobiota bacterium]
MDSNQESPIQLQLTYKGFYTRGRHALNIFLSLISMTALLFVFSDQAVALQLQLGSANANPGDNITVEITVGEFDQEQIAASAFTLSYNADYLTLTQIESHFFDTFLNQWNLFNPAPDPLPPTSVIVDGQNYTRPLLSNTIAGKTLLVGTRVKSGIPTTLFTLHFTVKLTAPPGVYPISISPTMINDVYAGYDGTSEAVPVLRG